MDKLGQVQERREDLEKQVQRLDCEVVELESRQIDAEIIRRNLESFSGFYTKFPPPQQKKLLALLVGEVDYDPAVSKMKLTLRPLPDLGFQVVGDKVSFDERLNWLPVVGSIRTWARVGNEFKLPKAAVLAQTDHGNRSLLEPNISPSVAPAARDTL